MLEKPIDVLHQFPIRKNKRQKHAFRDAVVAYGSSLDYPVNVEKGSFGSQNVILGDPKRARFLITAHYDTCARLPFPNLITPCSLGLYLLYQIVLTFVLLGSAVLIGVLFGVIFTDATLAGFVAYLCIWLLLFLMLAGPANAQNANDNTSGVVTVLEIARCIPKVYRNHVCFVLFDLEEAGLIGSSSYRAAHKQESQNQVVLNLDCIGDGDEILLFPTAKLRKNSFWMDQLRHCNTEVDKKRVTLREKGFSIYPSDQASFPLGVGIAAFHRNRYGTLYLSRIHTSRDTILEEQNVHILRDQIMMLIQNDADGMRKEI